MRSLQFGGTLIILWNILSLDVRGETIKDETPEEAYLDFSNKILQNALKVQSIPALQDELVKRIKMVEAAEEVRYPIEYRCDPSKFAPSPTVPTSVHTLRPADIKVVAAFGDSITACNGCGARNLLELALERRGESFAVGSDRNMDAGWVTLPNLLQEFGGSPAGYSTCWSLQYGPNAWFNVAQPGGRNVHMPRQANRLVELIKNDTRNVDFENDWKLFTLLIGGNDLCGYCRNPDSNSPENYRKNIEETVDIIKDNIPRSVFQIITMFDLTPVGKLSRGVLCDILQLGFCECGLNETQIPMLQNVTQRYFEEMEDLVNQSKYKTKDDFTVIHQHHMKDTTIWKDPETGEWDSRFLSVDCFHPNRLGHRGMAYMLWNAMLWPVGQKPFKQSMPVGKMEICCPHVNYPYIFTWKNSENVPWAPWQRGQKEICWNPSEVETPARKIVKFFNNRREKLEDKLARVGPPQKINRVSKRTKREASNGSEFTFVQCFVMGTGVFITISTGIIIGSRKLSR